MEDAELEEIRAKRLAQLRSQFGDAGGENRNQQAAEERENQANEIRNNILSQILDQPARARCKFLDKLLEERIIQIVFLKKKKKALALSFTRSLLIKEHRGPVLNIKYFLRNLLNTLMIGKPEKGKMVENMLLQMAQTGHLPGKISESELIRLLEDINKQTSKTTTVKFDRRRAALDNSDDEL